MAQSTPLIPVATADPVTFYFKPAAAVDVALHFFDVAGDVIAHAAGGSRDLLGVVLVASYSGDASDPTPIGDLEWRPSPTLATVNIPGGEFRTFALLANGGSALRVTPSGGSDPVGAVSYRIQVSGTQTRPQT